MLGFSVDSGDALFRSVHCIDTNGRWLTVVNGYGKALGVNSWQAQEFCSSLVYAYCVDNLPSYPGGVKAAGAWCWPLNSFAIWPGTSSWYDAVIRSGTTWPFVGMKEVLITWSYSCNAFACPHTQSYCHLTCQIADLSCLWWNQTQGHTYISGCAGICCLQLTDRFVIDLQMWVWLSDVTTFSFAPLILPT